MKSRSRTQRSKLANLAKLRRTWPKFQQRPFPPHSQPNTSPLTHNPQLAEDLAAMPEEAQMQPEEEESVAALQMQAAEFMQKKDADLEEVQKPKVEEESIQKQDADSEEIQKSELEEES